MGRELAETFPVARKIFESADAALGFAISKLCFEGPAEDLQLTANTQPGDTHGFSCGGGRATGEGRVSRFCGRP